MSEDESPLSEMDLFTLEMLSKPNKFKKLSQLKQDNRENPLFGKHKKHIQQTLQNLLSEYSNVCYGIGDQSLEIQQLFIALVDKIIRNREMQEENDKYNYDDPEDDPDIFTNMDSTSEEPMDSSSFWGNKITKTRETARDAHPPRESLKYKPPKMEPVGSLKSWAVPVKRATQQQRPQPTLSDF